MKTYAYQFTFFLYYCLIWHRYFHFVSSSQFHPSYYIETCLFDIFPLHLFKFFFFIVYLYSLFHTPFEPIDDDKW